MNYSHYALLVLVVLIIAVVLKKKDTSSGSPKNTDQEDLPDMNEVFLNHAQGRAVVDIVKVFNPSDLMILRSIFAAEGIDSYVKSNYFGDLYGSAKESIFSTTVISIFEDKAEDAKVIVKEYIKNLLKESTRNENQIPPSVQAAASAALGLPGADLKYIPELLL